MLGPPEVCQNTTPPHVGQSRDEGDKCSSLHGLSTQDALSFTRIISLNPPKCEDKYSYYPHFAGEKTETRGRDDDTARKGQSQDLNWGSLIPGSPLNHHARLSPQGTQFH